MKTLDVITRQELAREYKLTAHFIKKNARVLGGVGKPMVFDRAIVERKLREMFAAVAEPHDALPGGPADVFVPVTSGMVADLPGKILGRGGRRAGLLLIFALLVSCGSRTEIAYHEDVPQEQIRQMANAPAYAWTTWHDRGGVVRCDVYLQPKEFYDALGPQCYDAIVRHETRHCYEFAFHDGIYPIDECIPSGP